MKKWILVAITASAPLLFIGCTPDENSFEYQAKGRIMSLASKTNEMNAKIVELQNEIDVLKKAMNISNESKYTSGDINFTSVKILVKNGKTAEETSFLDANSKFDLSVDVMNTTNTDISQLVCQATLTYYNGDTFYDRYYTDTTFEALAKSVRSKIIFEDIPIQSASYRQVLTVSIKDTYGNVITTFEKTLPVK